MRYTIGELAEIIDGDRGKNYPQQHEFFDTGYCLFLNTGNVTSQGFLFEENQYITQEKCEILRKGKLQRGDIVYTTRGTVGNAAYYNENVPYEHVRINSGMVIIRPNNNIIYTEFLYQILKSDYYRPYFKQYCTGSAQPQLPIKNFSKIELEIPVLETQKKIADILSAYDDLIENNQKQIKLLEEAAQRLYKEWFVDLHFPGHDSTPIIDGIPQGWGKRAIESFGEVITGKTPSTTNIDFYNGDIPFVKIPDMYAGIYPLTTEIKLSKEGANSQKNKFIPKNSIIVSCIATVGLVNIAVENCQTNQQINSIILKNEIDLYYMYFSAKQLKDLLDGLGSNGATMTNVNKNKFSAIEVLYPTQDLVENFYQYCKPIFEKILYLSKSTLKLKEQRDILLPKLMNGEIEVGMDEKETAKIDNFDYIRQHWKAVPYDEDLPLAARSTGDISEETLEKLKEIAEEE